MKKIHYFPTAILAVATICWLLLYIAPVPVTQSKAQQRAFNDYSSHSAIFADFAADISLDANPMESLLQIDPLESIPVPDELAALGIESIYATNDVVYFKYSDSIMGMTPFGILITQDISALDEWYKTIPIEDDWYYYRIVS